jgi:1,4-alpha-glucan branching enzyme
MKKRDRVRRALASEDDLHVMRRVHSSDGTRCRVTFWLPKEAAPDATSVAVAGSFNDWSVDRHPMEPLTDGGFVLEIDLPAGTVYEFRYVIDGVRWENAWNADRYAWSEHARCDNSVIVT